LAADSRGGERFPTFFIMDKLSQDEIDDLIHNISSTENIELGDSDPNKTKKTKKCNEKYYALTAAKKRYDFALSCLSYNKASEARRYLHTAAFELRLANRNTARKQFWRLINNEIKKKNGNITQTSRQGAEVFNKGLS